MSCIHDDGSRRRRIVFLHQRLLVFDEMLINRSLTGASLIFNYAYLGFNEEKRKKLLFFAIEM